MSPVFLSLELFAPSSWATIATGGPIGIAIESVKLLAILLTPFVGFAIIIHALERLTQTRLAERFGWHSVLWTGWLGTPIHELSHAFMCHLFRHKIIDMALFEPDRQSGRLGYVHHSFTPGNWYQELGNFFIGVAPLIGGSIVLTLLMWMCYPTALSAAMEVSRNAAEGVGPIEHMFQIIQACIQELFQSANPLSGRFWIFVYFVLCVGSHMAPSPSDYEGAMRASLIVGGSLILFTVLLASLGTNSQSMVQGMAVLLGPLFAVFGFTIVLVAIVSAIVWVLTSFFPQRYEIG